MQLRAAVDAARMTPGAVVIHAPIRKDGDSYLPMVLTASNGDTGGVLMLLLDFVHLGLTNPLRSYSHPGL